MIGIYKIINNINKKIYIGQSNNIEQRFQDHKKRFLKIDKKNQQTVLYKAMRKYGIFNFSFEIIEECKTEELNEKELFWIDFYNCLSPFGYNIALGGNFNYSLKALNESKEIKNKIKYNLDLSLSEIAKEYKKTLQCISDINRGIIWKEESCLYPLRPFKKEKNYCINCGIEISYKSIRCRKCNDTHNIRKIPISKEKFKLLVRNYSFIKISKKFNTNTNIIRKWCKEIGIPSSKKEINSYSDEEWQLL